jgi:hypothetical protein
VLTKNTGIKTTNGRLFVIKIPKQHNIKYPLIKLSVTRGDDWGIIIIATGGELKKINT